MGFLDFATDLFGGSGDVSSGGDLFSTLTNFAGDLGGSGTISTGVPVSYPVYQPSYQFSSPAPMAQPYPTAAAMPQIVSGVARWAMKYPNLWQAVQRIAANFRTKVTPEQLWNIGKKMGLPVLTSIVGAAAVQELMLYKASHKRRRMDVANTKALRRSLRRIGGFDRLARRVSQQLAHSCHTRRHRTSAPSRKFSKRC